MRILLRFAAAMALTGLTALAQDKPPAKELAVEAVALGRASDFAQDVLPILKSKCLACHNAKDKEADLILESPPHMLKGGESGPAVVPGKPDESLLLKTAAHRAKPYMPPPKNKIGAVACTPRELGLIKLWIAEGAKGSAAAVQLLPAPTLKATPAGWNPIYAVAVDPDAQVVACGRAGRLFLYHVPTQKLLDRPVDPALASLTQAGQPGIAHTDAVQSIAFSPDGRLLATGGYRSIKIWRKNLPEKKSTLDAGGEPTLLALSADGAKAAAAFADFAVRLFDVPSGKRLAEYKDHTAAVVALRFSADGATLLTASADKTARLYGPTPSKIEAPDAISAADFAGGKVATGHPDGTIRVWTDDKAQELKGHKAVIADLRGAGTSLISVSQDGKLKVWALDKGGAAGKDIAAAGVTALTVSPDGKRWITVGAEGVKLWDADGGKPLVDLKTDGPARRAEQAAAALLAFAGSEVGYRTNQVKAAEDTKKKEDEEVKKAADAVTPAETALKEKVDATVKAKTAREAADKVLADTKAGLEAARVKAEAVTKAYDAAITDDGLKKLEAENAGSSKESEAAAKGVEEAQKKADATAKALEAAKAADGARTGGDKAAADKALAEAQKLYDDAKAKLATATKALADAKDDEAKKKAEAEKKVADDAAVALRAKRNDARTKSEAAAKTPASLPPSDATKKAETDKAAADAALAEAKKALEKAKPGGGLGPKLLAAARAASLVRKAEADKAAADQAPAVSTDPLKTAVDAAAKPLAAAKEQAAKDKAKADAAAKALADAKDDAGKKKAVDDKKAADEALAKAAEAVAKAEKVKADADAALANGQKAKDAAKAKVDAAAKGVADAKAGLDAAKKDVDAEKAQADAALKAGEAPLKAAEKARDDAKKAEDAAVQASEQTKLACESAKRRAEKAKDAAVACQKSIEEAQAALKAQQDEQKKFDDEKKKSTEAAAKASAVVKSACFSADGSLAVLGAADGRLFLFDALRGAEAGIVEAHGKAALGIAGPAEAPAGAKAGGTTIVSIGADGSVRTGAAGPTWALERSIEAKEGGQPPVERVTTLAFSPDGTLLASGGGIASREGELVIWKVADGTVARSLPEAHSDTVYDAAFSPCGKFIASAAADKFAKIFDVSTGKLVKSFEGHTYHVLGVSWSRTGRTLATAGGDSAVKVWSVQTGQQTKSIPGFDKQVTSIRYLGYEGKFAVAAGGTAPKIVKEDGNAERTFDSAGGTFLYALSASPDGRLVAAGGLDGVLRLWRAEANALAASFAP